MSNYKPKNDYQHKSKVTNRLKHFDAFKIINELLASTEGRQVYSDARQQLAKRSRIYWSNTLSAHDFKKIFGGIDDKPQKHYRGLVARVGR